jgi:hypothetical protein
MPALAVAVRPFRSPAAPGRIVGGRRLRDAIARWIESRPNAFETLLTQSGSCATGNR